ncbi:hypothetical protein bcere0009_48960 [Bacillus cereus R309803]|nr:hypothetical protein bcere0009_48960 [Bacillus cereus R309803]
MVHPYMKMLIGNYTHYPDKLQQKGEILIKNFNIFVKNV